MKFTAIDLFSGCGGFHLGLEREGFEVVAAVESEAIHCETYSKNFPRTQIFNTDISVLNPLELALPSEIDLVVGGPPCQGFSNIGKKQTSDLRNNLILEFARFVTALSPKYFIMENVRGMLNERYKPLLNCFFALVEEAGYKILCPRILNAKDYGVPQNRLRVFFLGHRLDVPAISYPEIPIFNPCITVAEAIGDLPEPEDYPELLYSDRTIAKWKENTSSYGMLMREVPLNRQITPNLFTNSRLAKQEPGTRERIAATPVGKQEPISQRQRLDPNDVAPTVRAGTGKNGRFTSLFPIHPWADRVITVREAARLQSIPDWFELHKTRLYGGQQVGNAVPPLLAAAVIHQAKEALINGFAVTPR